MNKDPWNEEEILRIRSRALKRAQLILKNKESAEDIAQEVLFLFLIKGKTGKTVDQAVVDCMRATIHDAEPIEFDDYDHSQIRCEVDWGRGLSTLLPRQREMLTLFFQFGYTKAELAHHYEITEASLSLAFDRALDRVAKNFKVKRVKRESSKVVRRRSLSVS
jgi:DNA-directed RNA polymerase specialized sigma24 family protein